MASPAVLDLNDPDVWVVSLLLRDSSVHLRFRGLPGRNDRLEETLSRLHFKPSRGGTLETCRPIKMVDLYVDRASVIVAMIHDVAGSTAVGADAQISVYPNLRPETHCNWNPIAPPLQPALARSCRPELSTCCSIAGPRCSIRRAEIRPFGLRPRAR